MARTRDAVRPNLRVQGSEVRCRANVAHIRQSRPDSGLGSQGKVVKTLQVLSSSLRSGEVEPEGGV